MPHCTVFLVLMIQKLTCVKKIANNRSRPCLHCQTPVSAQSHWASSPRPSAPLCLQTELAELTTELMGGAAGGFIGYEARPRHAPCQSTGSCQTGRQHMR